MKGIITSIFVLTIVCTVANAQTPIASYSCDGNGTDGSGNNLNGTVYGAVPTTNRFADPGKALLFDGSNDYVEVPHSNMLSLTNDFTVSVWFKTINSNSAVMVEKFTGMATMVKDAGYTLAINGNMVQFIIYTGNGTTSNPPDAYVASSGTPFSDNAWHNAVGVWDNSKDSMYLYVDGNLRGQTYCPVAPGINTRGLFIGKRYNNDLYFSGSLDDIVLYGSALNPSQVSQIYTSNVKSTLEKQIGYFDIYSKRIVVSESVKISVISLDGREVYTGNCFGFYEMEGFQAGLYYVRIEDVQGVTSHIEVMIN